MTSKQRRIVPYALLVLVIVAAAVSFVFANRPMVVKRPSLGGPPSRTRRQVNLVGRTAPAFTAVDLQGRDAGTAALRGRVVVLSVWATWCQPCVEELPRVEREIWQRYRPDVAVVAVARREDAAKIRAFNQRAKLTFALVEDPRGSISRRFGGDYSIPRTYVIDRAGVIVHQTIGYGDQSFADLVAAVDRAVAQRR
jgi:peroxiredoxin